MAEMCAKCPMRDERYIPSFSQDKQTINAMTVHIGRLTDFIEYLFEHSEHCDHISYSEAFDEFEKWEESQSLLKIN